MNASAHPVARYLFVGGVCALAGGVAGAVSALARSSAPLVLALTAAAAAVAATVALVMCAWWWRGLDEAAREAHKWAWWWGSTFGLAVGAVVLISVAAVLDLEGRLAADLASLGPRTLIYLGAGLVAGVQAGGYGVAWAIWWLRRR